MSAFVSLDEAVAFAVSEEEGEEEGEEAEEEEREEEGDEEWGLSNPNRARNSARGR